MSKFCIALSGDFNNPDGSPAFPDVDLSPLIRNPAVEWRYIRRSGIVQAEELKGFDALIVMYPQVAPESFPQDGRLSIIAFFGVGYDSIDVAACTGNACALTIAPDAVRGPAAVAAITFMLALTGKLVTKDRLARQGPEGWARCREFMGVGLVGTTLGVLGFGNIGTEVCRLARPFDMNLIAHARRPNPGLAEELGVRLVGLEELFRESDVLAVCCPLTPETRHVVNAERIALMKPDAYLINIARGPVVDEAALARALQEGRIAGAGLDVFEQEPSPADNPLFALDNVIVTPHALCWTDQCFAGIGAANIAAVFDVMQGRVPRGLVNREIVDQPAWRDKLTRYADRFGG